MDIYDKLEQEQQGQKLEIFVACRSLKDMDTFSKSDPQVILYVKDEINNKWVEYQRTEIILDNLNPNFVKTFQIDFQFEKQQYLKLEVIDIDGEKSYDYIGSAETTLGAIVGAKYQTHILSLIDHKNRKAGKIVLRAEQIYHSNKYLQIQFQGNKISNTHFLFGKTSPFLRYYKISQKQPPLLIYQSEIVQSNLNPLFKEQELSIGKICNADLNQPILVELWDHQSNGNHVYIGSFQFTPQDLLKSKNEDELIFTIKNKKEQNKGQILVIKRQLIIKDSFLDYIQGGTQLALISAIDFTASNGEYSNPESLHAIKGDHILNQYEAAIGCVSEILLNYDYDKMVPIYGFGGKPQFQNLFSNQVLHCFPLTGNPNDPEVKGLQGILKCYRKGLEYIKLSGPTLFSPLIKETMKVCINAQQTQKENPQDDQYYILVILTDGVIHDMEETKRMIVESSNLPFSIIIIGIGDADFSNMEELDGDDGLWDTLGNKAQRDLVQFVPFNKYKGNPQILANQVLEELPQQLEQYMKLIGRKPNVNKNIPNFRNSFTKFQENNQEINLNGIQSNKRGSQFQIKGQNIEKFKKMLTDESQN